MGKHQQKSKKHKKEKRKNHKSKHKKRYSSSSDSSSKSEEIWVEKGATSSVSSDETDNHHPNKKTVRKRHHSSSSDEEIENKHGNPSKDKRDEWMDLPTSFLSSSHLDRRKEREETKKQEKEKEQYNPRECTRELNPYWKNGGDGLPKFKKPTENEERHDRSKYVAKSSYQNRQSSWRKKKEEKPSLPKEPETVKKKTYPAEAEDSNDVLTEKELNILAAKLVKAEIMGNTKMVTELKEKLDKARKAREENASSSKEEEVLLTHTDSQGRSQPVKLQSSYGEPSGSRKRKKNIETHKDGERVRYFADDDKYSLKQMFENEKYNSVEDSNKEFITMANKIRKNDDLDDVFADNIRKKDSDSRVDAKTKDKAISDHQKMSKSLDNCDRCIQSDAMLKHLMISMGETAYLSLPSFEPLTDGHCLIVPIRHVPCATQLDENEWSEIMDIRKALVKLFRSRNEDVIFFESAMYLYRFPHMFIECIPMPLEEGEMAPIYFKKAIDESETEWSQNKKLVSLKGKDVRRCIPKGLAYFSVSFGMEEGFAHVVEDEKMFPTNFAQEIIGGMLDVHHSKWRKPKKQSFDDQSKRVLEFSKEWKEFDCTTNKF